jgi:hypothetical protein
MLCCAGDEVVDPATAQLGPGQIRDCNRAMLLAAVASAGAEAVDLGIARDVEGHLEGAVDKAIAVGADVLVTTGGFSNTSSTLVVLLLVHVCVKGGGGDDVSELRLPSGRAEQLVYCGVRCGECPEAVDHGIARDVEGHLEGAVDKAIAVGADVLVTTGGGVGCVCVCLGGGGDWGGPETQTVGEMVHASCLEHWVMLLKAAVASAVVVAVASAGAEAVDLGIARDVEGHLEGAVDKAIAVGTDVLVTTGVWVGGWVGVGDSGDRRMGWVGGGDSGNKGLGLVWVWVWVLSDPTPRTMGLLRQASCASCLDVRPM